MRFAGPSVVVAAALAAVPSAAVTAAVPTSEMAFVTTVAHPGHVRQATILLASLREFGGRYRGAPFVVVADRPERLDLSALAARGAEIVPLDAPAYARAFPYARKAYAAAQAEALTSGRAATLAWFDAGALVLAPPTALDLGATGPPLAVRPVTLANRVAQPPEATPDGFWSRIWADVGVDPAAVPTVETVALGERVRAYLNCEILSVRPELGLFREWAVRLDALLRDANFLRAACSDDMHAIFLHQAVLSAVVVARTRPSEWRPLPVEFGYPLNAQDRLGPEVRAASLEGLACVITERLFEQRSDWPAVIAAPPRLRDWIEDRVVESLQPAPRIYREEGSCNSYLVTTAAGNVIIDPGGAPRPGGRLAAVAGRAGAEAVLLTHGHADHTGNVAAWRRSGEAPVIAHRDHAELRDYFDRLAGFFAFRNSMFGQPADTSVPPTRPPVTQTFSDRFVYELGGTRFELLHTPGETPDTATIWIPELGAALVADNFYDSFPNLATLRGTHPRWALDYARAMDTVLALEPTVLLPGHGEPVVGRAEVARRLREYRDAILHVHDATVRGMNEGKDPLTLMREVRLPEGSEVKETFGRVSWAVRGIWDQYAGWFDGRVASMYAEDVGAAFPELVSLAGGPDAVAARAADVLDAGRALEALHLADVALAAAPRHRDALGTRLRALERLREATSNWIEHQLLSHAIEEARGALAAAAPETAAR